MTESRSQGQGMPRLPDRAMTPRRMPTLGSREKVALDVMARFIALLSMPRATPARQARMRKMTQRITTKAMMPPQIR